MAFKDDQDRRDYQREYYRDPCRKQDRESKHQKYRETPKGRATVLLCGARDRARKKGWEFDLTKEWLADKLEAGCDLTGTTFRLKLDGKRHPTSPSIDRIDNSIGYTKANCRVICWALNLAFNEWGEDAFREIWNKIDISHTADRWSGPR